jgi:predicted membrane protein
MDQDRWERKRERFERRRARWEDRQRYRSPSGHLFSGLVFVLIGALFLFGNMGMLEVGRILRFWPVLLIAAGVFKLVEHRNDPMHGSGIFWIVIGVLFLSGNLGVLRVAFRNLWPIILIGFGALMLWRSAMMGANRRRYGGNPSSGPSSFQEASATAGDEQRSSTTSSNSMLAATAILGGVERRNNSQDFRGGSATAIMGHCEIDLRPASIANPNEPVLEVFALWGGIEVRVPADWTVISQVDPILGGFEDKTQPPKEETKRFIIRGPVIMGGIEVTN